MSSANPNPRSRSEWIGVAVACGAVIASLIIRSEKKLFWMDELFTLQEATDPSWPHMVRAVMLTEGTTPLFPTLEWLLVRIFGASELVLRAPSAFGIVVAMIVTWVVLRRHLGAHALVGVAATFLLSALLADYIAEARCYGLLVGATGVAFACMLGLAEVARPGLSRVALASLSQSLLVLIHPFGGVTGAAMIAALFVCDARKRLPRPRLYAAVALGWLPYGAWFAFARARAPEGLPLWHQPVDLVGVARTLEFGLSPWLAILVILLVIVSLVRRAERDRTVIDGEQTSPDLLIMALAILVLPMVAVQLASVVIRPLFVPRYFLGGIVGWSVIIAHLTRVLLAEARVRLNPIAALVVVALCASLHVGAARATEADSQSDVAANNPFRIPIVTEAAAEYMPLHHYNPGEPIWMIVDEDSSKDEFATPHGIHGDFLMRRVEALYPRHGIIEGKDALADFDKFILVETPWVRWSERELHDNPAYEVIYLAPALYLVRRK